MKDEIVKLVQQFGLKDNPEYTASQLLQVIIGILSNERSIHTENKNENLHFNELATSKKPITEITISRGGVEYKFKKDAVILEMFEAWIENSVHGLTKQQLHEETEEMFQHLIEQVRPLFNSLTHLKYRRRYLLIFELLRLAEYPFTQQQLNANDQARAALIGNWFDRSTPKPSPATIEFAQTYFPDTDLLTPLLKTKQKGKK